MSCGVHAHNAITYITKQLSEFKIPIAFRKAYMPEGFHLQRCFFYCTCLPRNFTILNTSKCFRNLFVIFVEKQRQSCQVHTEYLLHHKLLLRPSLGFVRFNEVKPPAQCFLLPFVNFGSTSFSWGSVLQCSLYHCSAISFFLSVQLLQEQQSVLQ